MLTISEIHQRRAGLEERITNLLRKFEEETGTAVTTLEFWQHQRRLGHPNLECRITVTIPRR